MVFQITIFIGKFIFLTFSKDTIFDTFVKLHFMISTVWLLQNKKLNKKTRLNILVF